MTSERGATGARAALDAALYSGAAVISSLEKTNSRGASASAAFPATLSSTPDVSRPLAAESELNTEEIR
jgi:hypothetical protein